MSTQFRSWLFVMMLIGVLSAPLLAQAQPQQCFIRYAWTASEADANLRRIDLDSMTVDQTIDIGPTVVGTTVTGITGIAIEPTTGEIYFLAYFANSPVQVPFLCRYDPVNQITEVIGNTAVDFVALDILPNGEIYAISGDAASPSNSFCLLDSLTGLPTDICLYGGGDDGEAISYNTSESRWYHASGSANLVFEASTPGGADSCDSTSINVAGSPLEGTAVSGLAYMPSIDEFLWTQGGMNSALYTVSPTGMVTSLGSVTFSISDVAIEEVPTPCPPPGDQFIRGDSNLDNTVNIADVIFLLNALFVTGQPQPLCRDAADFNDDGTNNIADGIFLLNALFTTMGVDPPPPYPNCGVDGTLGDSLDCQTSVCP